eukprot:RCo033342
MPYPHLKFSLCSSSSLLCVPAANPSFPCLTVNCPEGDRYNPFITTTCPAKGCTVDVCCLRGSCAVCLGVFMCAFFCPATFLGVVGCSKAAIPHPTTIPGGMSTRHSPFLLENQNQI